MHDALVQRDAAHFSIDLEEGEGTIDIDGHEHRVEPDFAVIAPAGARHNVSNTGSRPLRLYTIYAPPERKDGVVHSPKADADARYHAEEWEGKTAEWAAQCSLASNLLSSQARALTATGLAFPMSFAIALAS